ncbi:MAG: SDR family NAD(P)-dependent oxidoreductase [Vicinamibacterales bacterium]
MAAVWTEVLGLAQVSVDANFFDIGGHSLRLIAVQAKLAEALDRTVPLVTLFQYPTVAALARHLSEEDIAAPPLAPAANPSVESIAIIGVAGRFPGAPDVDRFWSNLRDGVETIRRFSGEELIAAGVPPSVLDDPHYVPARGALADPDLFDAELFGYAPREAALLDPQQRLMLECAWTALENAGYAPRRRSNVRIGVYAGTSANTYILAADRAALGASSPLQVLVASDKDFLATRVSYKLELHGPAVTVQTACSTSLVAVHTACHALRAGECDVALAGGVSVTVPSIGGYRHTPDGIASPDGHCRPFDAQAGGTVAGNGVGVVVLKRLGQAVADGDNVLAVIRGSAVNNDGADKVGFTAPSVNGQAAVIAAAQADAGVPADTITYVEAHGTGTALGDPVEVAALRRVFGDGAGPSSCALASVKSNVGHLDAAAGITALIKVVLALTHRELPPSLHFTKPNPQLDLGPFYVPTLLTPWTPRPGVPRRAGVSSFGMGGTNAHVILEEAPDRHAAAHARPCHILPVSGHSLTAVDAAAEQLASWLEAQSESSVADVAFTQQVGRAALRVRRVATGRDASSIAAALRAAPARTVTGGEPSLVWLFPGQGTQLVGMGRALYDSEPTFRAEIDACAAALDRWLDRDLRAVLYPESADAEADAEARLAETTWTQVALVSVELALAALWQSWGLRPAAVLGHSVGELAAACVAGALTRESVLHLAATRGRLMHAAPAGGMIAIAGRADEIDSLLGPDLWLAAVNGASQCVVAGTWPALARLEACLSREGRPVQRLPASGAFHSGLMAGVVDPLNDAALAHTASPPRVPWISTVTGEVITAAPPAAYWGAQVTAPVQWAAAVASARAFVGAAPVWLELGPGHTLTRLVQPLSAGETAISAMDGADAAAATAAACGQAWAAGADVDWMAYHRHLPRQRLALPSYPFQRQRYWLEAAPRRDTAASARVEKRSDISQWLYVPTWKQMPPARGVRRDGEHCLLFAASTEVGERLKKTLEARGCVVTIAEPGDGWSARSADRYVVNPGVREDYATLFDALVRADRFPARIVHAWTADGPAGQESETDRGTGSIVRAVHAITRSTVPPPVRMVVLSSETQIVSGSETVSPARASITGLCRVIPQEHPSIGCRSVDIEPETLTSEAALGRLANELVADADDVVVALRGQWRWVQQFDALPAATSADRPPARSDGPYLITGGLGRIGLALAEHLARAVRTTFVLVTRSAFPARPDWVRWLETHPDSDATSATIRRLAAIEERGSRVLVAQADVTDRTQFAEAVARAEADVGAIRVAIHAAGATAEADFAAVTATDSALIERHRLPKLRGAEVVREVFRDRPLELCVLMSSLASVLGGLRFGAYAAANESLNRFADLEAAHGRPWISVAWDGWRFAESDREARGELAALAMTPHEGVAAFDRILDTGWRGTVIVSTGELAARMRRSTLPPADHDGGAPLSARPAVEAAFVEPRTNTEQVVARVWADSLGIDRVGVDDNFFELGGHSLLGVHLAARLSQELRVNVSLHDVLAHPTVAALSRIAGRLQDTGDVTAGTVARALEAVHQMSEEEVERLLAES